MNFVKSFFVLLSLSATLFAFSTNNVQYLFGDFNDNSIFDTRSGDKSTITLEHYSTNEYGDVYAFLDYEIADERFLYLDNQTNLYFEISPRFSLSRVVNINKNVSFIQDLYVAFQYNRQIANGYEDFRAYLYGVGADVNVKGFDIFGINVYKKNQNFSDDTYQLSLNYTSNKIFDTQFLLNGFTDWTENDFLMQNQLLYDFGKVKYLSDAVLQVGTEWHFYNIKNTNVRSNTLQLQVKVVF